MPKNKIDKDWDDINIEDVVETPPIDPKPKASPSPSPSDEPKVVIISGVGS